MRDRPASSQGSNSLTKNAARMFMQVVCHSLERNVRLAPEHTLPKPTKLTLAQLLTPAYHGCVGGCHSDAHHDVFRLHCMDDTDPELTISLYDSPNFHIGTASIDLRQFTAVQSTTFVLQITAPGDFHAPPSLDLGEVAVRFETFRGVM